MLTFKQFILEYLTPDEKKKVAKWEPKTPEATKATDHFFGIGNEEHHEPLVNTDDKSEIHREIEHHLGAEIPSEEYKSGFTKIKGNPTRISSLISDSTLKNQFKNDNTRKNIKTNNLTVRTTRSAEGIAGQTSHGQSWEQHSCKNFNDGSNNHYLPNEYKHGTVVSYLHDHEGKEIARATFQPYTNAEGNTIYKKDSYYGLKHPEFEKHNDEMERRLSKPHKGSSLYEIHPDVYPDSGDFMTLHPDIPNKSEEINKILDSGDGYERGGIIRHKEASSDNLHKALDDSDHFVRQMAAKHKNVTPEHISKALDDPNSLVSIAAISNKNASAKNIEKALNHPSEDIRIKALQHPNSTIDHIRKALKDKSLEVRQFATDRYYTLKDQNKI